MTDEPKPLAEELGVKDLRELIFGKKGRLFSAAGKLSPIAEFTEQHVVLHPPDKPLKDEGPAEDIVLHVSERGVLLDDLGAEKTIAGAKFRGQKVYWLAEQQPGTTRHYAGWFDQSGKPHLLYTKGEPLTTDMAYRYRNRTHDGELSIFEDLTTDTDTQP
ncbi:MAG: hypothetical protein HY711_08670 [Candidatus Melainabacteria bacterium]|nr:hypothetical protein [Candidatus Melainabacteria bacterium]